MQNYTLNRKLELLSNIKRKVTYIEAFSKISELKFYEVGTEWTEMFPNVHSILCSLSSENITVLNSKIEKGGHIPAHFHLDRDEHIFVVDGQITDTISQITTIAGNSYIIPKGTLHEIVSDYALLTVSFKPPYEDFEVE